MTSCLQTCVHRAMPNAHDATTNGTVWTSAHMFGVAFKISAFTQGVTCAGNNKPTARAALQAQAQLRAQTDLERVRAFAQAPHTHVRRDSVASTHRGLNRSQKLGVPVPKGRSQPRHGERNPLLHACRRLSWAYAVASALLTTPACPAVVGGHS